MDAHPRLNPGDGTTAILLAHLRAGPFLLTHKRYAGGFRQHWHEHPIGSIDFVVRGGGLQETTTERDDCGAGGIGYDPPNARHRFRSAPGGIETVHLVFAPHTLEEEEVGQHPRTAMRSVDATRIMFGFVRALLAEDRSAALHVESGARELLGMLRPGARDKPIGPRQLKAARDYLNDASDRAVGLGELADAVGVNRGHLARSFRSVYGKTPGAYHRDTRLVHAARRLAGTAESISRVAHTFGFSDQAHLTRVFRDRLGTTPGEYRRTLSGDAGLRRTRP